LEATTGWRFVADELAQVGAPVEVSQAIRAQLGAGGWRRGPRRTRKRQRRFEGFDDKILAVYSRGLSTRDIEAHLVEIYGVKVGRELISKDTDGVMDDVRAWAGRPL
jgi:Transposase, Mutator family